MVAKSLGGEIHNLIRADESAKGYRVVRPGDAPWLSKEDWRETIVVSVDGERVRLVLIHAKQPGRGAFTRLVDAVRGAGLIPCVMSPTKQLEDTLKRWKSWKWKRVERGVGMEREVWWEPRRGF